MLPTGLGRAPVFCARRSLKAALAFLTAVLSPCITWAAAVQSPLPASPRPSQASSVELPPYEPDATADRSAIPDTYKWDLTPLFPAVEAWEKAWASLAAEIEGLRRFAGRLSDPMMLADCLELYFKLHNEVNHVTLYANLDRATALTDDAGQAREQQSLALLDDLMREAAFIRTEVLAFSEATLQEAYRVEPRLAAHRAYLDKDDLPAAVYDNLVATVGKHLEPLHRYVELRRKVLRLPDLHLYYKYYVFTYATGIACGSALADKIRSRQPGAVEAYLEMLAGGSGRPPLELLKGAGIDLTRPDAIEAALELFEETLQELTPLLGS
ncbi:MAG: M3 family metallopeptidase [Planctomycetota bacterium]